MSTSLATAIARIMTPSLRASVREEIRTAALLDGPVSCLPPPHDLAAEQEIAAAVLVGQLTPSAVPDLRGEHFYSRLFGFTYAAAEAVIAAGLDVNIGHVLAAFYSQDFHGPELECELLTLRDCTPFVCISMLHQHAARIIELWRARQLIDRMQQIDATLRIGSLSYPDALVRMREAIGG